MRGDFLSTTDPGGVGALALDNLLTFRAEWIIFQSMTLQERLRFLLDAADVSRREVSRLAGQASEAHVGMILRGEVASPRASTINELARVFGVPAGWLAFGEGPAPDPAAVRTAVDAARVAQAEVAA